MEVAIIMIVLAIILTYSTNRKTSPRVPSELHASDRYEMTQQLEKSSQQIFMYNPN